MIVFFSVSFVAQSTIPCIVQQRWVATVSAFSVGLAHEPAFGALLTRGLEEEAH